MKLIKKVLNRINLFLSNRRDRILNFFLNRVSNISHNGVDLKFYTPNALCEYRAVSFSEKEPETLEWLDSMTDGSIFWDIGANVGIYSIYACKKKNAMVWAFEPSVFNLEILSRNINLNGLQNQIHVISNPLNNKEGFSMMTHSSTVWGGALSSFDIGLGYDGKKLKNLFSYSILGLTADFLVENLRIPLPDFIKIDVDGIEHLILKGAEKSLQNAKEILVELNEDFNEQNQIAVNILTNSGFYLAKKGEFHHPKIRIANQIWVKK